METINLFLIDMCHADNTSGVDRYMHTLIEGLNKYPHIKIHWINLRSDLSTILHKQENFGNYTKITIPLPQDYGEIISNKYWLNKYNEQVFRIISTLFANIERCIVHIHTLNLIDLALYIKSKVPCKIITHLHCIPWKDIYNSNKTRFNQLYALQNTQKHLSAIRHCYVTNNSEIQAYEDSDAIICVTKCATNFLQNIMGVNPKKCIVIPNGISDFANTSLTSKDAVSSKSLKLLYVGVLSDSKGLRYILDAIRKVQQKGISVSLYVAGKVSEIQKEIIERENRDLSLHILGRVSFETLMRYYKICDVGIIASLQEQSSYVAIEMAMFGLPIITTAVDGLDEMFEDGIDALKVKTCFSDIRGLEVDTTMMANKIIEIFNSPALRERLSCNVRDKFLTKFQLDRMVEQTVEIYNTIINTDFN